jgi:hypothetical protein
MGFFAGYQRHYFEGGGDNCSRVGTTAVTVLAGPLNYVGVNPKIGHCSIPQPSA